HGSSAGDQREIQKRPLDPIRLELDAPGSTHYAAGDAEDGDAKEIWSAAHCGGALADKALKGRRKHFDGEREDGAGTLCARARNGPAVASRRGLAVAYLDPDFVGTVAARVSQRRMCAVVELSLLNSAVVTARGFRLHDLSSSFHREPRSDWIGQT